MSSMRSVEVVEALPDGQLFLEIDIAFVGEELIELVFVGSVGSLDLAIELRCRMNSSSLLGLTARTHLYKLWLETPSRTATSVTG